FTQLCRGFRRPIRLFGQLLDGRPAPRRRAGEGRSTIALQLEQFEDIFAPNNILAAAGWADPTPLPLSSEDGFPGLGLGGARGRREEVSSAGSVSGSQATAVVVAAPDFAAGTGSAQTATQGTGSTLSSTSGPSQADGSAGSNFVFATSYPQLL